MSGKVLTQNISVPLTEATTAIVDVNTRTGNLTIDELSGRQQMLATGTLEYMQGQEPPSPCLSMSGGQANLALKAEGGRRSSFRLPWSACNAETDWQIHVNPAVSSEIIAHSGGGNLKLDLGSLAVTRVLADSGGGNMDVVLPSVAADLKVVVSTGGGNVAVEVGNSTTGCSAVDAKSGAGNVTVRVPSGLAARIQATSGMGKVVVDARFGQLNRNVFQSPDYDSAANKVEITLHSGAGNVIVETK